MVVSGDVVGRQDVGHGRGMEHARVGWTSSPRTPDGGEHHGGRSVDGGVAGARVSSGALAPAPAPAAGRAPVTSSLSVWNSQHVTCTRASASASASISVWSRLLDGGDPVETNTASSVSSPSSSSHPSSHPRRQGHQEVIETAGDSTRARATRRLHGGPATTTTAQGP